MTSSPGYGIDLDRAVTDALSRGESNTRLVEPYCDRTDPILGLVAINQRLDLVKLLLKAGATMSADDFAHVLYWWPSAEIVTCLLESDTPHDAQCLQAVIRHGQWDLVEILIDHGADIVWLVSGSGHYLLHIAAWQGKQVFLNSLLRRGADVHRRDLDGLTALMKACDFVQNEHMATPLIVETLLQHGSDPNAVTPKGASPLLLCTAQRLPHSPERTEIARTLLRYGADPNLASPSGVTPLMLAARDNNLLLAAVLVEANASTKSKNRDGRTAADIAMVYKSDHVLNFLQQDRA